MSSGLTAEAPKRHGQWKLALAAALVIGLVWVVCRWWWHSPEPVYQGKTVAEWFNQLEKAYPSYFVQPQGQSSFPPGVRVLDQSALLRDASLRALRALGTNAALYLGREFERENGPVARWYVNLYYYAPAILRRWLPSPKAPGRAIALDFALRALGSDATPAVPAILKTWRNRAFHPGYTLGTLATIPFDRQLMDPLLEQWTRYGDQTNVLAAITTLQVRTRTAADCLARIVAGGQLTLRRLAVFELEKFGPAAAGAVPALMTAVSDPDEELRYGAARALAAIGPQAAPARAALAQATNDTSVMVQRASARALKRLQGQDGTD